MNRPRMLFVAMCAIALSACASLGGRELGGSPTISVVEGSALPAPDGRVDGTAGYRSTIGPFDKLVVDVLGFTELSNRRFQADARGTIVLPIGGEVSLLGLTLAEASAAIEAKLRENFVRNPQASVNLEEAVSQYVTVDGQVREPGNYPVAADMTLMRAVAAARGAAEFAKLDDVVVFRTVNGRRMIALYQLSGIRRGLYPDPHIYPQDVVIVGESAGRRLFNQIIQLTPALTAPIVALLGGYN